MVGLERRLEAFLALGRRIGALLEAGDSAAQFGMQRALIARAERENPWFTEASQRQALQHWAASLTRPHLEAWLREAPLCAGPARRVLVIGAGNVPLVAFHDVLCVLITGHRLLFKPSTKDAVWIPFLLEQLVEIEPSFASHIEVSTERARHFDAVIATGSNNSARYFEYYFSAYPHLLRRGRHSVAVLDGSETAAALGGLAEDVFGHYGMGCRSVTKLFLPKGYDRNRLFEAFYPHASVIDNPKYANNYDYHRAVYAMNGDAVWENGFLLLKEDPSYSSPIAVLFYEEYERLPELEARLERDAERLQVVVGKGLKQAHIAFGQAQKPGLQDYADGVDTLDFLTGLK